MEGSHGQLSASPPTTRTPSHPSAVSVPAATPRDRFVIDCSERPLSPPLLCSEGVESHAPSPSSGGHHSRRMRQRTALTVGQHLYSVVTALESLQYEAASPPSLTTATCSSAASPAPCTSARAAVCTQGERRGVVSGGSGGGADTSDGQSSSDTYTITDGAVAWLCGRLEFLWKSALLHSDTRGSSHFAVKHNHLEALNSEIGKTKREEEEEEAALLFPAKASPTPSDATAPRPPPLPSLPVGPESEGGHRGCSGRPMPDLTGGSTAVGCAGGRDEELPCPSRRQDTHRDSAVGHEDDGDGNGRLQLARLRARLLTRLLALSALRQVRDERAAEHDSRKRARSGGCRSVMDVSPQVPSQKEEEEEKNKAAAAAAARDTTFVSAESEINSRLVQEWLWQRVASLPRDLGGHVPLASPFPLNDVRTTNDGVGSHVGASTRFEGNLSHLLVEWCALELADATTSATSSSSSATAAPTVGPTRLVAKETRALAEALKAMEATLIAVASQERSDNATPPSLTGDRIPTREGSEGMPIAATLFDSTQSPAVVVRSAPGSLVAGPQAPLPSGSTALASTPPAASTAAAQESGPSSVVPSVATTAGRVLRLSITKPPISPATENTATARSREDEDAGVGAVLPPAVMHGSNSSGTATATGVEGAPAEAVESGAAPQPPRRFALQLFSSRSAHEPPRVRAAELPDDAAEASVAAESGVAAASLKKDQVKGESVLDVARVDEVRRTLAHCGCLVSPCCHHHHENHHDQQKTLERQLRWCRVAPFILYARRGTSLEADLRVVLRGLGFAVEKTAHRRAGTVKASQQTKRRMRRKGRKRDSSDGEADSTAAHVATADVAAPAPLPISNVEGDGMRPALSLTTPSRTPPCPLSRLPPLFATYAWLHYGALRSAWLAHVAEPQPARDGPERVCALSNAADNSYDVAAAAASASSFLPWRSPPAALCSGPNSVAGVSTLFPCVALADHSVAAVLHDLLGTVAFSTGCGQDTGTSGFEGVLRCHRYHCPADLERRLYRYMCYPMAGVAVGVCGQGGLTLEEWRAYARFRYGSRLRRGKPKSDPTADKGAVVAGGAPLSGAAITPHEETLGSPRLPLTAAAAAAVVAQHRTQRPSPIYSAVMDVTAVLLLTELSQVCCAAVAQEAAVLEACVAAVSRSVEAKGDATRRAEDESVTLSLSEDQRIMSSWATLNRRCAESRLAHTLMCARCDTTGAITTSAAALSCVLSGVLESDPLLAVYAEQLAVGREEEDGSLKESTLASSTQHPLLSVAGDDDHANTLCTVVAPVSQPSPAATKDSPSPPASSKAQGIDSAVSQAEALVARASSLWLTLISVLCVGESAVAQYVRRVLLPPPPMLHERSRRRGLKSARNTTTHSAGRPPPPPPTAPPPPLLLASLAPFTRANMFESSLEDLFHEETSQHGRPAAPLCEPHATSAQQHHHQQRQQPEGQELRGRHECTTESAVSPTNERDTRVGEAARAGGEPFASSDEAEGEEGEAEERCRVALAAAVALRHPRVLLRQLDHLWRLRSTSLPPASSLSSLPLVAEHRASLAASQRLMEEPKDVTDGDEADETKRRATEEEDEEEERRRRDAFASRIGSMVECVHLSSYAGVDVTTRTTPSTAGGGRGGRGGEGTWPLSHIDSLFSRCGVGTAASAAVAPPLASKTETNKSSEEFAVPAVSLGIVDTPPTAAAPTVPHTAPPSDRASTAIHVHNTTAVAKAEEEQHLVQASPAPSRPRLQLTPASHAHPHPSTAEAGTAVPERNGESGSRVDKRARSPPVAPASLTCSSAGGAAAPHSDSRRGSADGGPSRQHGSPITMRRVEAGGGGASTGGKGGGVAIDAVTHSVARGPLPCLSGVTELRVRWRHTDPKQPLIVPTAAEEGQVQEGDAVLLLELVADTLWEALGHLFCHAPTAYVCPTRADGAPAATPATAAGEGGAADAQAGAVQLATRPSPLPLASAPLLPPPRAARRTLRLQLDPALVKVQRLWRSLQPPPASASVSDSAQRVVVLPLATTPSRPSSVLAVELPAAPASTSATFKAPTPHPSPSTRQGSTFSPSGGAAFTSPTHADLRHYGTVTASVRSVLSMTLGYAVYRLLLRLWDLWAAALHAEGSGSDDGDGGDNDRGTHASLLPSSSVPSAREEEKRETKTTSGRGAATAAVVSLAETPPAVQRWLLQQLRAMGEGVLHPLLRSLTVRSGVPQPRREPLPQREQQPQQRHASSASARALPVNTSACALREGDEETAWLAYPPLTRVLLPSLLHRYDAALQPSSGRSAGGGAVRNADVPFASSCADCAAPADGKAAEDVSSSSSNSRVDAQRAELAMEVREAWVRVRQSLLLAGVCV